ncbi:hypothetical protein PBY51_016680 [Eleginops maclovinus]|uniref:RRM domain-containing protein n=1 Tax=Eleginops maclovinus TaxID=56733 RepID=A0AAN7WR14_ELEMC|nr:hypothetical protein PBY51_016680 [Eleginops maclovinus]
MRLWTLRLASAILRNHHQLRFYSLTYLLLLVSVQVYEPMETRVEQDISSSNADVITAESHDDTLITAESNDDTVITAESQDDTVITAESQDDTLITAESNDDTLITAESNDDTLITAESNDDTLITAESNDDTLITAESNDDTLITAESQDDTLITAESQDDTLITAESNDDTLIKAESQDDTLIKAESQDDTLIKAESQDDTLIKAESQDDTLITAESQDDTLTPDTPRPVFIVPNRLYVRGIDYRFKESDLVDFFSQYGPVSEVKIVIHRSGISEGYAFVTFGSEEDALKVLHALQDNGICLKGKELRVSQAFSKHRLSRPNQRAAPYFIVPPPINSRTNFLKTPSGFPFVYHKGMAYFNFPNMVPPAPQRPPAPQVPSPQPVYQQPVFHRHPNECPYYRSQWNVMRSPLPSTPVLHSQQSEYLYWPPNGGPVPPQFVEPMVGQAFPMDPPRVERMTHFVLHPQPQ